MKKLLLVGFLIAAIAVPAASFAQVETSVGTLQIGAKVKWVYIYRAADDDAQFDDGTWAPNYWDIPTFMQGSMLLGPGDPYSSGMPMEQFATSNVELDIAGTVGDKVSYLIELQASTGTGWSDLGAGGLGMGTGSILIGPPNSSNDELLGSVIGLRQAYIVVQDVIPMTTVTLGTGSPPVGIYQRRATNDYDLISLPLINSLQFGGIHSDDVIGTYNVIGFGWQATGVLASIQPMDMLTLNIGYHNGYMNGNYGLFGISGPSPNIDVAPVDGALICIAWLNDNWLEDIPGPDDYTWDGHRQQRSLNTYVVSASYATDSLEANFDWMQATIPDYTLDDKGDYEDLTWTGYQLTVGYWFTDAIEALVRYENVDPNTLNDEDDDYFSENDQWTWITLGMNWRIVENAEVSVNYIFMQEQGGRRQRRCYVGRSQVPGDRQRPVPHPGAGLAVTPVEALLTR